MLAAKSRSELRLGGQDLAPARSYAPARRLGCLLAVLVLLAGCQTLRPCHWSPDQARLPTAEIAGNQIMVRNVRHCAYRTAHDYQARYDDREYDLSTLDSVDFLMVPFSDWPGGAHTFLSFGFQGRDYVSISVEARRPKGESYEGVKAMTWQYPIMYVIGDERDLIQLRANYRRDDVYMYRVKATPREAQALFVDMLQRTNDLATHEETYHLFANNCATNLRRHINRVMPGRVPYTYQIMFPGYSDSLVYQIGLIANNQSWLKTKRAARINEIAYQYRDAPDFSQKIRSQQSSANSEIASEQSLAVPRR